MVICVGDARSEKSDGSAVSALSDSLMRQRAGNTKCPGKSPHVVNIIQPRQNGCYHQSYILVSVTYAIYKYGLKENLFFSM